MPAWLLTEFVIDQVEKLLRRRFVEWQVKRLGCLEPTWPPVFHEVNSVRHADSSHRYRSKRNHTWPAHDLSVRRSGCPPPPPAPGRSEREARRSCKAPTPGRAPQSAAGLPHSA